MGDQGVSTQLLVPSGSVCFSYVSAPWKLFLRKEVGVRGRGRHCRGVADGGREPSLSPTNTGGCLPTTDLVRPGFPSGLSKGTIANGFPPPMPSYRCSTPGRTSATPTASSSSVSR